MPSICFMALSSSPPFDRNFMIKISYSVLKIPNFSKPKNQQTHRKSFNKLLDSGMLSCRFQSSTYKLFREKTLSFDSLPLKRHGRQTLNDEFSFYPLRPTLTHTHALCAFPSDGTHDPSTASDNHGICKLPTAGEITTFSVKHYKYH